MIPVYQDVVSYFEVFFIYTLCRVVTATDVMLEHGISSGVSLGEVREETSS